MKKVLRSKHSKILTDLEQRIQENCLGVLSMAQNVEYCSGEIDLLVIYEDKVIYFEVKSNYSPKSWAKGKEQLRRWTHYMSCLDRTKNYIGVYISPQYTKPLFINGKWKK